LHPQEKRCILANPNTDNSTNSTFGLIVNGREFLFLKLQTELQPQYSCSYTLSIERDTELYQVLSILKRLGEVITS
jgi:hypothetical protein